MKTISNISRTISPSFLHFTEPEAHKCAYFTPFIEVVLSHGTVSFYSSVHRTGNLYLSLSILSNSRKSFPLGSFTAC